MITEQQLKLVRRILDRGFKEVSTVLEAKDSEFRSSPERQNNFIIDLSSQLKASQFDYLSFIHSIEPSQVFSKPPKPNNLQPEKKQSRNLNIKLLSFNKLSLNGAPCTLLFKINDQPLADPIHRCYTNKYSNPQEIQVSSHPQPEL